MNSLNILLNLSLNLSLLLIISKTDKRIEITKKTLAAAIDMQEKKANKPRNPLPDAIVNNNDDFKKINVALSRAKEQMILFHSIELDELKNNDFRKQGSIHQVVGFSAPIWWFFEQPSTNH